MSVTEYNGSTNYANNFNTNKTNTIMEGLVVLITFNHDVSDVINLINLIPSSPTAKGLQTE